MSILTRLTSLDAFRGITIAAMVLVNNPGDWGHIYAPLRHSVWHGCTFADLVFPFFLFAVGVSMSLSLSRQRIIGIKDGALIRGLWKRAAILFLIGLGLNLLPSFDLTTLRIPGVLQRIALCTVIAAPIVVKFGVPGQGGAMLLLLLLHSFLLLGVSTPDFNGVLVKGVLEPGRDFGASIDRMVFDRHLWATSKTWDPEGVLGTLSATGNILAGAIAGAYLRRRQAAGESYRFMLGSVWVGTVTLFVGHILDQYGLPINKSLWTTSYTLWTTGIAVWVFALFFYCLDAVRNEALRDRIRASLRPFTILGMNALFIFVLSGLLGRFLNAFVVSNETSLKAWLYTPFKNSALEANDASLAFAVLLTAAMYGVALAMWKHRLFIKV